MDFISICSMKAHHKNDIILKAIGLKLKSLRKAKGYKNYEQFAFTYDLSRAQYGRYENGANLTIKTLHKILLIHQLTFSEFFDDSFQELGEKKEGEINISSTVDKHL